MLRARYRHSPSRKHLKRPASEEQDMSGTNRHRRRLSAKNAKVCRPTLFNYVSTREEIMTYTGRLFTMMTEEKFDVKIHKIYPLKDVAQAHNVGPSLPKSTQGSLLTSIVGSRRPEDDGQAIIGSMTESSIKVPKGYDKRSSLLQMLPSSIERLFLSSGFKVLRGPLLAACRRQEAALSLH